MSALERYVGEAANAVYVVLGVAITVVVVKRVRGRRSERRQQRADAAT